jgi:2-polyprenyl-3-methyl-5-hydroxy-6-metoxy-1,4-benzoquinol methylase
MGAKVPDRTLTVEERAYLYNNEEGLPYNPEIDQDRVKDLYDDFCQRGEVMFHQQRQIYSHLGQRIEGRVIEVGCGVGLGSAMMVWEARNRLSEFVATDKLAGNVSMASQLYPWIEFHEYDLGVPVKDNWKNWDHVVAVEVFEHVARPDWAAEHILSFLKPGGTAWVSTPNGKGKRRPPDNPFHVCEYTTREMLELLGHTQREVLILSWKDFSRQQVDTDENPLVYKVVK